MDTDFRRKVYCETYPWGSGGYCVLTVDNHGRPLVGVWARVDVNEESGIWLAKYNFSAKAPTGEQVIGWHEEKGLMAGEQVEEGQGGLPVEASIEGKRTTFFLKPERIFNPRIGQWEPVEPEIEGE